MKGLGGVALLDWCGFVGGSTSLGMGFEVSNAQARPKVTLSAACRSGVNLSAPSPALGLPHMALLPAMMIMA